MRFNDTSFIEVLAVGIACDQELFFGNMDQHGIPGMNGIGGDQMRMQSAGVKSSRFRDRQVRKPNMDFVQIRVLPAYACIAESNVFAGFFTCLHGFLGPDPLSDFFELLHGQSTGDGLADNEGKPKGMVPVPVRDQRILRQGQSMIGQQMIKGFHMPLGIPCIDHHTVMITLQVIQVWSVGIMTPGHIVHTIGKTDQFHASSPSIGFMWIRLYCRVKGKKRIPERGFFCSRVEMLGPVCMNPGTEVQIKEEPVKDLLVKEVRIDWERISPESYVRRIDALQGLECLRLNAPVTFLVGENGSGKSTLLEAIAVAFGFNPEGGTRNYRFSTHDSHSELWEAVRLVRSVRKSSTGYFLRAESFYNVATAEEEYSRGPGGRPMHFHERSHGEGFLALVQEQFRGNGLFLLDEPEAALSPQRQLTLLLEMDRCVRENAQFLIVTHSPILLGFPGAQILSFDDGPIHPVTYEETSSYQITSMFLNNRERFLQQLLDD